MSFSSPSLARTRNGNFSRSSRTVPRSYYLESPKFADRIRDLGRIVTIATHRHCQAGYANSHGGRYKQGDIGLLAVSFPQMFDIGVINPPLTPVDRYSARRTIRRRCIVAFQGISPSVDNNRLAAERMGGETGWDA